MPEMTAISWHLLQGLGTESSGQEGSVPRHHPEDTRQGVRGTRTDWREPRSGPREEARCILDCLAGFTLTPVIWNFVAPGLSAGRVQSVAPAMVIERECARLKSNSADCWDVVANATAAG
ncbi:DNA topoisomerase I [Ectocarpus siliculosus]|uniref:DNA topoisomerase I n=1 Tax=Ectocarpus siliculosus TaxID=2880 RepID=D7G723_ECTSI|nr:DNA topoisomerase I [Ectocarpus siliculosus]|eukprot:CBJ25716.1 DNA topoisomerase I [Ectocarpus siliculosus]